MRISKGIMAVGMASVIGAIWLCAYGCDKRATQPWPPPPEPKDYPVYFANQSAPICYCYLVVSGTLDTVALPFIVVGGMDISPNGNTLYVAGMDEVAAVDVATGNYEVIWSDGAINGVTLSPNGRYLALHSDELNILELASLTVVHHEAEAVFRGIFSTDSRRFYAPTDHCQILQISLEGSGAISRTSFPGRCYGHIAVSEDESRWYLYDIGDCYGRFEVYDLATDSVIFSDFFRHGYGLLEPTADGQYVFFSNPGMIMAYCWQYDHELAIGVYEVGSNQLAEEISTRNIPFPVDGVDSTSVLNLATTPDGRWLIGMSCRGDMLQVDIESMEIVKFSRFEIPRPMVRFVVCQTNL